MAQISNILGGSLRQQLYDDQTRKIVRLTKSLHAISTCSACFSSILWLCLLCVGEFEERAQQITNYSHSIFRPCTSTVDMSCVLMMLIDLYV